MAARFVVLNVSRGTTPWADKAISTFDKRLRRMGGIEERTLKPARFSGDVDAVRADEGKRLLAALKPRDRLVCMDERGEDLTTEGFVELVREGRRDGRMVFALGGPYGHDPAVRSAAWRTVRLSSMVLNHQIARVVLYEQVYRAMTVIEGIPYHH